MKKLVLLTGAMLMGFACTISVLSFVVTQSWQQPQNDEMNITINPTVDEFLSDKVKQYKFKAVEIMDNGQKRELAGDELAPPEEGMITFAAAAAFAGDALSKLHPDIAWEDVEFEINLMEYDGVYTDYYGWSPMDEHDYSFYYVDIYTGNITYTGYYSALLLAECTEVEYYSSAKVDESLRDTILQRATEIYSLFDYENLTLRSIYSNGDDNYREEQFARTFHISYFLENDKILSIELYDIADKNYPFKSYLIYTLN